MENKNQFTLIDEEGKKVVYDVLFTFDSEETNKSYIVYIYVNSGFGSLCHNRIRSENQIFTSVRFSSILTN